MLVFFILFLTLQQLVACSEIEKFDELENDIGVIVDVEITNYSNPTSTQQLNLTRCCQFTFWFAFRELNVYDVVSKKTGYYSLNSELEIGYVSRRRFRLELPRMPELCSISSREFMNAMMPNGTMERILDPTKYDDFRLPWKSMLSSNNSSCIETSVVGDRSNSSMSLKMSIACRGKLSGRYCNLRCVKPANNPAKSHCISVETGKFSICDDDSCEPYDRITYDMLSSQPQELKPIEWVILLALMLLIGIIILAIKEFGHHYDRTIRRGRRQREQLANYQNFFVAPAAYSGKMPPRVSPICIMPPPMSPRMRQFFGNRKTAATCAPHRAALRGVLGVPPCVMPRCGKRGYGMQMCKHHLCTHPS